MSIHVSKDDKINLVAGAVFGAISLTCAWGASAFLKGVSNDEREAVVKSNNDIPVLFNTFYRSMIPTLDNKKLAELASFKNDDKATVFVKCVDRQVKQASLASLQDGKILSPAINTPLDPEQVEGCMKSEFAKEAAKGAGTGKATMAFATGAGGLFFGLLGFVAFIPAGYRVTREVFREVRSRSLTPS